MSRLHTTLASVGEVAMHFGAALPQGPVHFARETTEGADGLVVFESRGRRLLRSMGWGFPRPARCANMATILSGWGWLPISPIPCGSIWSWTRAIAALSC